MRVVSPRVMHNGRASETGRDHLRHCRRVRLISCHGNATAAACRESARACVGMHVYLCCGFGSRRTLTSSDGRATRPLSPQESLPARGQESGVRVIHRRGGPGDR